MLKRLSQMSSQSSFRASNQALQNYSLDHEEVKILGHVMLQPTMSEPQRIFLQSLQIAYISTEHTHSSLLKVRIWGSVITGDRIIFCPNATTMKIMNYAFVTKDAANLQPGSPIGILGMDQLTGQRVRVNGVIFAQTPSHVVVTVHQAYGDCAKYTNTRKIEIAPFASPRPPPTRTQGDKNPLNNHALELIRRADTFFLATSSGCNKQQQGIIPQIQIQTAQGCDISYRGGIPGFVVVETHPAVRASGAYHTVKWADNTGNNLFNALGNIALNPRAGLLFIDWLTGDALQITGPVEVLHDERGLPGAERTLELTVHAYIVTNAAIPLACPAPLQSTSQSHPTAATTATTKQMHLSASSVSTITPTTVKCTAVLRASPTVVTFEFALPPALQAQLRRQPLRAGQHATFEFPLRSRQTLTRTWSISSDPDTVLEHGVFTITVKRVGQVSSYLHDKVAPGSELKLKAIAGAFTPDFTALQQQLQQKQQHHPQQQSFAGVLMIAGGIGITPLYTMLRGLLQRNIPVTLLYSVRERAETIFCKEIEMLFAQYSGAGNRLFLTITRDRGGGGDLRSPPGSPQQSRGRGEGHIRSPNRSTSRSRSKSRSRSPERDALLNLHRDSATSSHSAHTASSGSKSGREESPVSDIRKSSKKNNDSPAAAAVSSAYAGGFTELTGRVDARVLRTVVPDLHHCAAAFLCGPEGFMRDVSHALLHSLKFPYRERIYIESYY